MRGLRRERREGRPVALACEPMERRTMMAATPLAALPLPSPPAFRPPSVPLVVNNPYLSVWSNADHATGDVTREWDGRAQPIASLIRVDGTTSRLLGAGPSDLGAFPQTDLAVTPTRTIYSFDDAHIHVTLTFTTPALPTNLDVLSRPITYLTWDVRAVDGRTHDVQVYASVSAQLSTVSDGQVVQFGRQPTGTLEAVRVGTVAQTVFEPAGDRVGIDWGNAYLAGDRNSGRQAVTSDANAVGQFRASGYLKSANDAGSRPANVDPPVLAISYPLKRVGSADVSRHVLIGYDEQYAVNYFGQRLVPYWKRTGLSFAQLLAKAEVDYPSLVKQSAAFDQQLTADLTTAGGPQYAQVTALAYRQALAATELAADRSGKPLLFTKEQSSNGDIATADIVYPTSPLLLTLSPTLAKASLVPLLGFASSPAWAEPYAPHDLGTFPQSLGEPSNGEEQPVEESGNLLILVDAVAKVDGGPAFANQYWSTLTKWAEYLQPYAYDPGNQLTTDDFLGTIDHSVNLAIKAIEGLGAYSQLARLRGDVATADKYLSLAKADAAHLLQVATDGDHLELGYGQTGTWSEKYNLVWDKILGLNLFPASVAANEVAYYKSHLSSYGVQLESTRTLAKTDWETWAAALSTNKADFQTLFAPIYGYLNTTTNRTPLSDLYDVNDVNSSGFTARSVVGGLFVQLLADPALSKKYYSAGTDPVTTWAPFPKQNTVLATGSTWKYTTDTPPADWTGKTFNDAAWQTGVGGFGVAGTPGVNVRTNWSSNDIYLRKTFRLPGGPLNGLSFYAYHDEDAQIYVNGVQATAVGGYIVGYQLFNISSAALAQLKPNATVTITVHCHQTGGGQGIDVGLVNAV